MILFVTMSMGLAALSIDLAWMRVTTSQCQAVADAAASAALIELRRTGDTDLATDAAVEFIARNVVGDGPAEVIDIEFGRWNEVESTFTVDLSSPHAVRVVVGRPGDNPIPLYFAQFLGKRDFSVQRESIAATRSMQVVLVMDITGSFEADIHNARAAALDFLELLSATHGEYDMIGMALYYYKFGVEYTPLRYLDDEVYDHVARTAWSKIDTASVATSQGFNNGGKHPAMPRQYGDESGTDHHVGIEMARMMFADHPDPFAFRATVVLTDGVPTSLSSSSQRAAAGYVETRWRVFSGPVPYSTSQIRTATLASAQSLWAQHDAHLWSVSYDAQQQFLVDMTKGVGKFYYTEDPGDFVDIFADIASSLPVATVR